MKIKVPVNEPFLLGNEKKYLMKCIKDGFVSSTGPFVEKFSDILNQEKFMDTSGALQTALKHGEGYIWIGHNSNAVINVE